MFQEELREIIVGIVLPHAGATRAVPKTPSIGQKTIVVIVGGQA